MKNLTKQIVRHFNHKHSRFLQHLVDEDKLKLQSTGAESSNIPSNFSQALETTTNNCFSTNQVLVIIAVTCFLNFAFIILIMMCVQILGSTSSEREISEEDALLNTDQDDFSAETDHLISWEASKIRVASFPDNIITRNVAERILRAKMMKNNKCDEGHRHYSQLPVSRTYHFSPEYSLDNDESESEIDFHKYTNEFQCKNWNDYGTNCTVIGFEPQKDFMFDRNSA